MTEATTELPFATSYEEASSERNIYDPKRDGLDFDPLKVNWASRNYQLPTGDKLGVFKVANTSLFRLGFVEKTANNRTIPDKYSGMYTSASAAQVDLETYLLNAWMDAQKRAGNSEKRQRSLARAEAERNESEGSVLKNEE